VEEWEVEASTSEDAPNVLGWPVDVCRTILLQRGHFAVIHSPKDAVHLFPPIPGWVPICPVCNVTMIEKEGQGFWGMCNSCD